MPIDFKKEQEELCQPKSTLAKKKPDLDISNAMIDNYAIENGYAIDINDIRRHHEIYLFDPRKTAPEKLKIVIRHPIRRLTQ